MLRNYWNNLRIAQRFMLAITPVLIVLLVSGCLLFDRYVSGKLTDSFEKSVGILADSLHESVKGSLERGQMNNFQKLLWNQRHVEGVIDVSLFSKEGKLDMSSTDLSAKDIQLDEKTFDLVKEKKEQFTWTNGSDYQIITPQITTPDCIRCHQEWQVDELGGIIRLTYDLSRLKETIQSQRLYLAYGCSALVVIITLLLFFVTRTVTKPVLSMTRAMQKLADNDLEVIIPGENRKDEIGAMGSAVNVFKENALKRDELERSLTQMAESFESNVGTILSSVLSELAIIQGAVNQVASSAESTNALSTAVVDSSASTTANVQAVAVAIEDMNSTNAEINSQVKSAADISTKAVGHTAETNELVLRLANSASEIEQVVGLISEIAEQTDLLALNATIEAARAGEAGKGFAVVASEVKELAAQTKTATKNIAEKIRTIQSESTESVEAIKSISTVLNEINDIAMTIAESVNKQQRSSDETSENMQRAASESEGVSQNLTDVVSATEETGQSAKIVQEKINDLVDQTDTLKRNLNEFIKHVRREE